MSIRYGHELLEFEVRRTPLKSHSVRIHLDPMLGVWVSAPPSAPALTIRQAVRRRAAWIFRYLGSAAENEKRSRGISGEQVLYLGRRYMLKVLDEEPIGVRLYRGRLEVRCPGGSPKQSTELQVQWFRGRARVYLAQRVSALFNSMLHDFAGPPDFTLRWMRRRWASCSPRGRLVFNPVLLRAPRECIDYVVAHELAHLKFKNHSDEFYECLNQTLPNWKGGRDQLDMLSPLILN